MASAPETPQAPDTDRIAKVMARAGLCSRRDAEKMILAGRVAVNGKVIDSPALDVSARDKVTLDGKPIDAPQETRVWLYYKPLGLVTSEKDEKGRQTVFDTLPEGMPRVMSVGRLDLNSEGLLLLTNDGGLKRRLELPETGWLRKYRVRVNGRPDNATFDPLRRGITIDGEDFQPMEISLDRQQGANAWLTVGIREGRNREIRRAMEEVKMVVNRLIRVSYGPFRLNEMQPGDVTEVKRKILRDQLGERLLTGKEDAPARPDRAPRPEGDRKPWVKREDGDRKPYGERAPRPEGDRKPWVKREDGDRKPYGERAPRPEGDRKPWGKREDGDRKPYGDRAPRPEGDRKPWGKREDGDRKPYGDRAPRPEGDRKPWVKREDGDRKPYGDRAPRPEGDRKPWVKREDGLVEAERKPRWGASKPGGKPSAGRAGAKPGGVRASAARSDDRPAGKTYGDRPASKSYGDKPAGKSAGYKSHGGRPGEGGGKSAGYKSHGAVTGRPGGAGRPPAGKSGPRGRG